MPTGSAQPCVPLFTSVSSFASGVGSVAFLFCVHFLLFPVATASRAAAREGGFEMLVLTAFTVSGVANGIFGLVGSVYFGPGVSSIVLNDINGALCLTITKILLCIDLFCSYPLVFAAGRQIVERSIMLDCDAHDNPDVIPDGNCVEVGSRQFVPTRVTDLMSTSLSMLPNKDARCRAVRTALVLVTVMVAQLRDFGMIISLVGSFAQVSLAFVLPPFMVLRSMSAMSLMRRQVNIAIVVLGTLVAGLATGVTIAEAFGVDIVTDVTKS